MIDQSVLITGGIIFVARVCDVSLGTIRTIATVMGKTVTAFMLAIFEVSIWIAVASTVIHRIYETPVLVFFYAFGYATGNAVGIIVERKLAFGVIILKVFTHAFGDVMSETLRTKGQPVTVFMGEGLQGPVAELYIGCRRRDLKWIIPEIQKIDPDAFYVVEQARSMSKLLRPVSTPLGGWRAVNKRK